MPNTTKRLIADQVLFRIYGDEPPVTAEVKVEDIYKAADQLINTKIRGEHFEITLPSGETIPDALIIAPYENIVVQQDGTRSYIDLPVMPVSLPRNVGVFAIYSPDYPEMFFIPLQAGMRPLMRTDAILSDLFGMVTYEVRKTRVTFNKNLVLLGVTKLTAELVVFEIDKYSETDALPIPADMESVIVAALYEMFAPDASKKGDKVDNYSPAEQPKR